jgi:hypothetical protein
MRVFSTLIGRRIRTKQRCALTRRKMQRFINNCFLWHLLCADLHRQARTGFCSHPWTPCTTRAGPIVRGTSDALKGGVLSAGGRRIGGAVGAGPSGTAPGSAKCRTGPPTSSRARICATRRSTSSLRSHPKMKRRKRRPKRPIECSIPISVSACAPSRPRRRIHTRIAHKIKVETRLIK